MAKKQIKRGPRAQKKAKNLKGKQSTAPKQNHQAEAPPKKPQRKKLSLKDRGINLIKKVKWLFVLPFREMKTGESTSKNGEHPIFRFLFATSAIIMLVVLPRLAWDAGISGDEEKHHIQGQKVYNYYATGGGDTTALSDPKHKLHMYGQSFDLLAAAWTWWFNDHTGMEQVQREEGQPLGWHHIENLFETRHVLNALVGWLLILYIGIFLITLAGWRAGLIGLWLMFLSPRLMGHSFNNPADIPFALGYVVAIYYMLHFVKSFPRPRFGPALGVAVGIGIALSTRVGGLLPIAYLGLFTAVAFLLHFRWNLKTILGRNIRLVFRYLFILAAISLGGIVLGILPWPYALVSPVEHMGISLDEMTNVGTGIRQLFEGTNMFSEVLPWYYIPKYMIITIPDVVLLGLSLFIGFAWQMRKRVDMFRVFIILFSIIFPIFWIIYKDSNVYGGWRHLLFTYPFIGIAAALGFEYVLQLVRKPVFKYLVAGGVLVLLYFPASHIVRSHPNQYIYYNEISGGVDNAYGYYEMDYYYSTIKQASEWMIENIDTEDEGKVRVFANFSQHGGIYWFRHDTGRFVTGYMRYYDRGNKNWDYAIVANSYINGWQIRKGYWPPANTIHTIDVDGVPVCAILKREDKNDFLAAQAMEKNQPAKAIELYQKALEADPYNETAILNLSKLYLNTKQLDKALATIEKGLKFYPDWDKGLNIKAMAYINQNKIKEATAIFEHIVREINQNFSGAYYYLGVIYTNQGRYQEATDMFAMAVKKSGGRLFEQIYAMLNNMIEQNPGFRQQGLLMIGNILKQSGNEKEAQQFLNAAVGL